MKYFIYSIVAALFLLNSCKLPESRSKAIKIYNYSKDTIAFTIDGRTYNSNNPHMFDSLPDIGHYVEMKPNRMFYYEISFPDSFFNNYPDKKTRVYIFSLDTLNKYTWKEIKKRSNYLRRYELSREDLDSLNWTITYP